MQAVINNVDGAIDFILNAEKDHPNRIDTCRASTSGALPTSNPLNQGASMTAFSGAQGQGNPFGTKPQSMNTPAFGAPSNAPQSGAFGQPSALGQKPSVFGGAGATPAFGGPSQLGTSGAFGRPSALGQKQSAFGAPSNGQPSGASGAAAPFSSFSGTANPFSQPQGQQSSNIFGTPSNPSVANDFPTSSQSRPQNPFGQPSVQTSNPFGAPSNLSQASAAPAPFVAPSTTITNPFGQPSTNLPEANANPFSTSSESKLFAQGPTLSPSNPFNNIQQAPTSGSPMDTRQIGGIPPLVNGSGPLKQDALQRQPRLETYSSNGIDGRLAMFKGMRVSYKADEAGFTGRSGAWQKIWFPQGPPAPYKDTEMEDSKYEGSVKSSYMSLPQSNSFPDGIMPLVPPRREWCTFDF